MQNVKFKSIDEFLEYIPAEELKVVEFLRNIIFNCMPDITEKLSYNVLFYKLHTNICFIWPASVFWGKTQTYTGVRLGFTNGNLLQDDSNYLNKGNRKQVYWRDFQAISEIDAALLKSYLFEAIIIDQEKKKEKIAKNRKKTTPPQSTK